MLRFLRWTAIVVGVLVVVVVAAGFGFYKAATVLPQEYQAALAIDQRILDQQRQEFESQISALYSESQRPAPDKAPQTWETLVTDAQINGWLATRLRQELPELKQQGLLDPRVLFSEAGLKLAFRIDHWRFKAVVMFQFIPFLAEDGRLGIELTDTRIGAAPLPTSRIVELTRAPLEQANLPLQWSTVEGRPALLLDFEKLASDQHNRRILTAIKLQDGLLYVAGQTEKRKPRLAKNTVDD